jgi:hypothetical protein
VQLQGPGPVRRREEVARRRIGEGIADAGPFVGAVDARRFSGMLTSFDPDPALARFSPGDLLLSACR